MPAPDYTTLFDIAPAIERAMQTLLGEQLATHPAFIQRETENLPAERIDVQFALGAWTGHWGVTKETDPRKRLMHAAWNYELRFSVHSRRLQPNNAGQPIAADDELHARAVARIRELMQPGFGGLSSSLLPFHHLASIDETSAPPQVSVEDELDISTLSFNGIVVIRSDAWPAT